MENATVFFPRGISNPERKGEFVRKATIRKITGFDEQALLESHDDIPLHSKVLMLLEKITTFDKIKPAVALRKLSLGERTLLLLNVRKLMKGDQISCVIDCLHCKKIMTVNISITALFNSQSFESQDSYELVYGGLVLHLRPLTSEDQDLCIKKSMEGESLVQNLARACIVHSEPVLPSVLPDKLVEVIGSRIDAIDSLSDISINLSCPECHHEFSSSFPAEKFILEELIPHSYEQLEREVHWLAFHYHWSEHEILSLPTTKRKRYVELVNTTIAGESV